jgi:membrane-bound lytic murein transglycosylase D
LGKIARQYGISVSVLMQTNNLRSTTIGIGQRLVVPVPSYDTSPLLAQLNSADVVTVDYGRTVIRPILSPNAASRGSSGASSNATPVRTASTSASTSTDRRAAPAASTPTPSTRADSETSAEAEAEEEESEATTRIVYTVQRGDNLTVIARKYGVSISDIRTWNGISGSRLQVGQRLHLFETNPDQPAERPATTTYRVRRGDTLGKIAQRNGVSIAELRRWNNLSTSVIRVGQRLTIHASGTSTATTYKVRRGDSLSVIARKHGVSINDLKRWNSLTSNRIRIGQTLTINS